MPLARRSQGDSELSVEEEQRREDINHKYHFLYFALSNVGVLALFVVALLLVGFYRPFYNTVDVIIMLATGMILGAVYVESQDKLGERYRSRLAEADGKKTNAETR